jgi:uncharacterized phage-associated protein
MIKISNLAEIIVSFFNEKGDFISNKKLQKLLYYIQAWHFVYFDGENIFEEDILPEAWVHGPVFPSIYSEYKRFGFSPITVNEEDFKPYIALIESSGLTPDQVELLEAVLKQYGNRTAFELEYLSHSERPWLNAREGLKPFEACETEISKKSIVDFYSSQLP